MRAPAIWEGLAGQVSQRCELTAPHRAAPFQVLPRRWIVERTLAWITSYRRRARDYERLPACHEAMVTWAMITSMSRRLARPG